MMALIYHGCMTKNADGSNKLIGHGEKCLVPTANYFQKDPEDIKSRVVKTCSQTKNQRTVSIKDYDYYFLNKARINRWISALDSEVYVMKSSDHFYVV